MDRWTMQELNETDDITFAMSILNERGKTLSPYSPLGTKLHEAAHTLSLIKTETEKYMAAIHAVCNGGHDGEDIDVPTTDLSDCDAETKAAILANAALLDAMEGGTDDEDA